MTPRGLDNGSPDHDDRPRAGSNRIATTVAIILAAAVALVIVALPYRPIAFALTSPVAEVAIQEGGFDREGFIFYDGEPSLRNKLADSESYFVRNPSGGRSLCYYILDKRVTLTGTGWSFQLREWESWGQHSSYKPGIDWGNPPRINDPTPSELWEFLNKYVNHPTSICNPDAPQEVVNVKSEPSGSLVHFLCIGLDSFTGVDAIQQCRQTLDETFRAAIEKNAGAILGTGRL